MQLPDRDTPVTRCETLAYFTGAALQRYAILFEPGPDIVTQLNASATLLDDSTRALMSTQANYRTAVLQCIAPRVEVKLVDLKADNEVRSGKRAADDAGKDIAFAIYPEGITPIIRPIGQSEVDGLRALEGRILAMASRWPGATASHARITHVRTQYETAIANRTSAMNVAAAKRALRNAAKEDYLDAFSKVANTVKLLFPRDRVVQDTFFDEVRSEAGSDREEVEPKPEA